MIVEEKVMPDQAFVHVGAGVPFVMIVEPEERLLFPIVVACWIVQIQVVGVLARSETGGSCVWIAVALGRRVAVVQVREESVQRITEVISIEVERILVEMVLEPHENGISVKRVDHRTGERPVESVDRAPGQIARIPIGAARRNRWISGGIDRQRFQRREVVLPDQELDSIANRIRQPQVGRPDLVRRAQRALPAYCGSRRIGAERRDRHGAKRWRNNERIGEHGTSHHSSTVHVSSDQRTGRVDLNGISPRAWFKDHLWNLAGRGCLRVVAEHWPGSEVRARTNEHRPTPLE